MKKCHNQKSPFGLSWFITPLPAILWIGTTAVLNPNTAELRPIGTDTKAGENNGLNTDLKHEAHKIMRHFSLNPHYYKVELTLAWCDFSSE